MWETVVHIRTWKNTITLVYRRRSTWRPFSTHVTGGAQRDVWPWQCMCPCIICFLDVHLVCHGGGLTTKCRQPLWIRSQKVCVSGPMFIWLFSLFWWVLPPLKRFDPFLTPCLLSSVISVYVSRLPVHSQGMLALETQNFEWYSLPKPPKLVSDTGSCQRMRCDIVLTLKILGRYFSCWNVVSERVGTWFGGLKADIESVNICKSKKIWGGGELRSKLVNRLSNFAYRYSYTQYQ